MQHRTAFVKKTKDGQVLRIVREHYVRDDIPSGTSRDPSCPVEKAVLSATADHYVIVDTNVVLHNTDLIEHSAFTDVIVLSTVFKEVAHKNSSVFLRLKELLRNASKRFFYFSNEHQKETYVVQEKGETPNDRNDRAIRTAAKWYQDRVRGVEIILVTADQANREKAKALGLNALSVQEYVRAKVKDTEVLDMIAWSTDSQEQGKSKESKKRQKVFSEHLSFTAVQSGIKAGRLHQGSLRVNRYNPFEGWVTLAGSGKVVLVKGKVSMNRAFDGDTVVVELLDEAKWEAPGTHLPTKSSHAAEDANVDGGAEIAEEIDDAKPSSGRSPTGVVVGIVRRSWRARGYAGSLREVADIRQGRTMSVLFAPVERRFPFIRLQTRQAGQLMDKRIVVVVDDWPADSQYPNGHYVRTLGAIGDAATETDVLLLEHDVNTAPFTPAVHACVPPLPWSVSQADIDAPYRMDLRHLVMCSVDPPGCKDIDDVLHARTLDNGNIEVGVHIADVSHFVAAGSPLDEEAARRARTVYLVERRIDMLPKPLTEDICSLKSGVERLAFSVLWELTPEAEEVNVKFTKSIIKSSASLTYEQAQIRIDDERLDDEVTIGLRLLMKLAKVLRKRRYEAGALNLASPEVKFKFDSETNNPTDVAMYQLRETNMMVEEMMLMANITVARHTHHAFPACAMLRRHQTPTPTMFQPLLQAANAVGVTIETASSKALADSLDRAIKDDDPYFNKLIRIMATRCMTQAKYFSSGEVAPSEFLHYGLAAPIYTHFTSPIRRYADIVVHRLLAVSLGLCPLPQSMNNREHMAEVVDNMNQRHLNAQMAGRSSSQLHTLFFFRDREVIADARVVKVQANGLIVFVVKYGIEGPVFFDKGEKSKSAGVGVVYNEANQTVKLADGTTYKIFDKVAVKVYVEKKANHREVLNVDLVDRSQLGQADQVA